MLRLRNDSVRLSGRGLRADDSLCSLPVSLLFALLVFCPLAGSRVPSDTRPLT